MDEKELHAKLEEKVSVCWSAYVEKLLKLSPSELISQADEISAASFCCDQLTSSPGNSTKRRKQQWDTHLT